MQENKLCEQSLKVIMIIVVGERRAIKSFRIGFKNISLKLMTINPSVINRNMVWSTNFKTLNSILKRFVAAG